MRYVFHRTKKQKKAASDKAKSTKKRGFAIGGMGLSGFLDKIRAEGPTPPKSA